MKSQTRGQIGALVEVRQITKDETAPELGVPKEHATIASRPVLESTANFLFFSLGILLLVPYSNRLPIIKRKTPLHPSRCWSPNPANHFTLPGVIAWNGGDLLEDFR